MDDDISLKYHMWITQGDIEKLRNEMSERRGSSTSSSSTASTSTSSSNCDDLISEYRSVPDQQTFLHIAASIGQESIIKDLFSVGDQVIALLLVPNENSELPIHVAIKTGEYDDVVSKFISDEGEASANLQLTKQDKDGNTALHLALDRRYENLSETLFDKCKSPIYVLNKKKVCPLYQAINAGFFDLANRMINYEHRDSTKVDYAFQNGKSILHAAITAKNIEILEKLINQHHKYKYSLDKNRTILSYAADIGFVEGVKHLLENHGELAYWEDRDSGSYPIHMACRRANIDVLREFYESSTKTTKLCDKNKRNILHYAAKSGHYSTVEYLLKTEDTEVLINSKDKNGYTPLHLATMGEHPKVVLKLVNDVRVDRNVQDNEGRTALDKADENLGRAQIPSFKKRLTRMALLYANVPRTQEIVENQRDVENQSNNGTKEYKGRLEGILVVSILVATAAFTATFQIPGGFDSDKNHKGLAVLADKPAFQVFILSNTLAMYSSIFSAVVLIWAHLNDIKLMSFSLGVSLISLGFALTMMSITVMSGLFVVLHNKCNLLSILCLVLGALLMLIVLLVFFPLCSSTSPQRNCFRRWFFTLILKLMLWALPY